MKQHFTLILLSLLTVKAFAQWTEVGGYNTINVNNDIYVLSTDTYGNLYAGGNFRNTSNLSYVAKYDGNTWSELGGVNSMSIFSNGIIHNVVPDNAGNVYVSGSITNANLYGFVAKYDGTSWSELGGANSLSNTVSATIWALCVDPSGNVYAAGGNLNSNGNPYVAKYDGTSWSELGGLDALGIITPNGVVGSLCSDAAGNIYAAGTFTNVNGHSYVAKYDGTSWTELGGLDGLAANFQIMKIMIDNSGNIYATGAFTDSTGLYYVAKFDGTNWSHLGPQGQGVGQNSNMPIRCLASDPAGNIYAAGDFTNNLGLPYVAKWNGSSWGSLGIKNSFAANGSNFRAMCADTAGQVYAAGSILNPFTPVPHIYVAMYDSSLTGVWPGDVNNDSTVNFSDLLDLGLSYNAAGFRRDDTSNIWQPYPANNWSLVQPNGMDLRYADCNADGYVDYHDTTAIAQNFSLTHARLNANNTVNRMPQAVGDIYFVTTGGPYNAGDTVKTEVWLGTSTAPVNNIYGIAFTIGYDAALAQSGTERLTFNNTWLGTSGNNQLSMSKIEHALGNAYGATVCILHTPVSGFGNIADFKFKASSSISADSIMHFSISDYTIIDAIGTQLSLNTINDSVIIHTTITFIKEQLNNSELKLYPNPARENVSLITNHKITGYKIYNLLGEKVLQNIDDINMPAYLNISKLPKGIYCVQVQTEKGIENKKLMIE